MVTTDLAFFGRDDDLQPGLTRGVFKGRTVLLIHPAWHACGTATVVASQARAYRALGARVLSLALSDQPVFGLAPEHLAQAYLAATPELSADRRLVTGVGRAALLNPVKMARIGWSFAHGDHAATYVAFATNSAVPAALSVEQIDLVHCNHFFCMPLAEGLRSNHKCPIVLDTHDIQAKQYLIRNAGGHYVRPHASYEEMLATELAWLARADLLIHLNSEEDAAFRNLLPSSRHTLLYPAVDPMPTGPGGGDFVIVASANVPNLLSLEWFLGEVMPQASETPLAIYGNVDRDIARRASSLYSRYSHHFRGRVDDIRAAYQKAAGVLLPTVEGHGLSIKTVEALSSGAPLIATRHAFRGIDIDPTSLANVTIADDAPAFAAALRQAVAARPDPEARPGSATRRLYDVRFSPAAYREALDRQIGPLLRDRSG
jgi:glycosyltransferase involved in cell wall biosynthesis